MSYFGEIIHTHSFQFSQSEQASGHTPDPNQDIIRPQSLFVTPALAPTLNVESNPCF